MVEIGLDYHMPFAKEEQKKLFGLQLSLESAGKPVSLHIRGRLAMRWITLKPIGRFAGVLH